MDEYADRSPMGRSAKQENKQPHPQVSNDTKCIGSGHDYTSNRKLDKTQYERMLSLQFINNKENIIIIGPAGIGKSYLAQAIG